MPNPHGTPIWYELVTPDPDSAQAFYEQAIGWTTRPFPGALPEGVDYRILTAPDGEGVAGLTGFSEEAPPGWYSYIGVDDVDAAADAARSAGGTILAEPFDLPGLGRMALIADPGGATIYAMKGFSPEASMSFKQNASGHGEWHELYAADDAVALAFYERLFGWTKQGAMPMGEMGDYSFLALGETPLGAVMPAPPGERPRWNYFFRTGSIEAAKDRIGAAGGTVTMDPMEVPGGDWVLYASDPQGLHFGLVGSKG